MNLKKRLAALALTLALLCAVCPAALASGYITRGEAAARLAAAADDYNPGVQVSDILRGYADGDLREHDAVTRAQALVMLRRAFGDLPAPAGDNARSAYSAANFTDVPAWAQTELADVFQSGIVAGTTAASFSPNAAVTDTQLEKFIDRVFALEGTNLKDDFYASVNKNALDSSVILPGCAGAGSFTDLGLNVNADVAALIAEAAQQPKTDGERKISALYHNILDIEGRNAAGIAPIQPYLDAINGAVSVSDLIDAQNSVCQNLGSCPLLGFGLAVDARDSNSYVLTFSSISPALGQSGYTTGSGAQTAAYLAYLQTLSELVGRTGYLESRIDADNIWNMEYSIASRALSNQELGDVDKTYNLFTMEQLQAMFPHVDLQSVLKAGGYAAADKIQVTDVGALTAAAEYFNEDGLETLKSYCRFALAANYGTFLGQDFLQAGRDFNAAYLGITGTVSDEELAAQYVQSLMSDYLGRAYVDRHFSAAAKRDVEKMVRDIIAVYKERLQALDWMSSATKAMAIHKLDTMTLHIGYPDQWPDDLKDTEILTAAEGGSFLSNVVAISKTYRAKNAEYQKAGVDKSLWAMTPDTVNACYDPSVNSITFPAAILQPPFYDANASYEQNLGSIGYVIAHEITHAFDNNGAKYDEFGNAADWWTAEDYAAFQALCASVVSLYDGVEAAPGITCSGALTLSENIADLGAVACITELESRRAKPDYASLYTAAGEIWYSSYTREMKQYLAVSDVHAPDKLRGSLALQQFPEFYEAFGITEGDGMWLAPENRVTIW